MIQVVIKTSSKSGWSHWSVNHPVIASGRSKTPLFCACRKLKSMGVAPVAEIGLFHNRNGVVSTWSIKTTVGKGAELTVVENPVRGKPRFVPYRVLGELSHE